ncbi:MAG: UDP-N-acetylmuramoyl-L-alanyl-D-glutamate--2,6-diaminopimelate ligase [Candidatus Peregrinibacteria bacterium Gr01-1014_25]|nr:MAG: UDP-N-acetylmuramoyl-L-alanyl-D-glutamate--2,6-diaminopimelate ligase [Candidatus Peregrinibacteria bacterium Gr01-1014_25]
MLSLLRRLLPDRHPLRLLWHRSKAFAAALRYGFPARRLTVIGITGTDGKTTTVGMVAHILRATGRRVGMLSTASIRVGDAVRGNPSQKTSPSPFVVQKWLRACVDAGCTHAVLEYSSHGLVQFRTHWTWPAVAAITNTAMEHLDYHGTMEQYRRDKGILFHMLGGGGTKVLNADDATYAMYTRIPSDNTITFAANQMADDGWQMMKSDISHLPSRISQLWASDVMSTPKETSADIHCSLLATRCPLRLPIPGAFNASNALCALGCAEALGIPLQETVAALASFTGVPGRMERIDEGQPFSVFIDFAVTPQAFEKTLTTVRQIVGPGKRVLVLTGSCGDRMKEKRPLIGAICSEKADVIVVTDDESYAEDPRSVMEDVWAGVDQSRTQAHKIFDRREAIARILALAGPGDAVILCGLGSYPIRMTPSGPIPWNEQEITRTLLREQLRSPPSDSRIPNSAR